MGDANLMEQKCPGKRRITKRIVSSRSSDVPCAEIHLQQQWIRISFQRAEPCHELCSLPIADLAIIERNSDQHCGYGCAFTFSYGEYCKMYWKSGALFGLPHSTYSLVVNGIDASSISFSTSVNGTSAITALNKPGRIFTAAVTSSPPALPPRMTRRSFDVNC